MASRFGSRLLLPCLLLTAWLSRAPAAAPVSASSVATRAVIVVERDDAIARDEAIAAIERAGGRVVHAFDGLLVVEIPEAVMSRLTATNVVQDVTETTLPPSAAKGRSDTFRLGLATWNGALQRDAERPAGSQEAMPPDPFGGEHAFLPPVAAEGTVAAAIARARDKAAGRASDLDRDSAAPAIALSGAPFGAAAENTSEFLAGRITINLVLMESDGTIDTQTENWTADREALVVSNVVSALDWLRDREPQARLSFTYHLISGRTDARARTGYEPIKRSADPSGGSGEALWLPQILGKLGYTSGDRWVRSRAWAHASRSADGSDWAVNVFVADSLQDVDGKFADGQFAYTWVGGPHVVMTYDNQAWGIGRMYMVFRHELLHAFYAFDEYSSSGCACTSSRGYLNGPGTNCTACNAAADSCVMIANGDDMCAATRRQIGWADLDLDGMADVIGQDPDTFVDAGPSVACGPLAVTGLATVVAATNLNPLTTTPRRSISVARVSGVEIREGSQAWIPVEPADGAWDGPLERFSAVLPPGTGMRHFEVRAVDDYGNIDGTPSSFDVTIQPGLSPTASVLQMVRINFGVELTWSPAEGAAMYRIEAAPSPTGAWGEIGETDGTMWFDDAEPTTFYRVTALDACGTPQP